MITEKLFSAYINGNHADAWRAIAFVKYRDIQGSERAIIDRIIKEALLRIEKNIDIILSILHNEGFEYMNFGNINPLNQTSSRRDSEEFLSKVKEIVAKEEYAGMEGHIPLFYASFISHFNTVDFRGRFEQHNINILLDALFIYPFTNMEELKSTVVSCDFKEEEYIGCMFSPDQFTKEDISGGSGPCVIIANELLVDNFVANYTEDFDFTFLEYIRFCFYWSCFPNLYWATETEREPFVKTIQEVREKLIPF